MRKKSPWSNPRWRKRSKRLRQNARCANCRSRSSLQVHHLKYEKLFGRRLPLWMAWPWNLMVLCADCHSQVSRIHHSGRANHREATVMVMGVRYHIWNVRHRAVWIIPAAVILAIAVVIL